MTNTQKLIIALKELVKHQDNGHPLYDSVYRKTWHKEQQKLLERIRKLERKIIKEENSEKTHPEYDRNYLNECIEKATPNLSKIKDVDKTLDEIRGVSTYQWDEEIIYSELEAVIEKEEQPEPDINTPFFGNSGATVPIFQAKDK